ncbi:MAG: hypothetical protein RL272_590 [Candidatus Parcubacteria bacterium]
MDDFLNVLDHGFSRVAVVIPRVAVADPAANAEAHAGALEAVYKEGACYALCPELGLTGYSCGDVFHAQVLAEDAMKALGTLLARSTQWRDLLVSVGMPLVVDDAVYNCAVTFQNGRVLAVAPKSYPPEYREFYELRHFARAPEARSTEIAVHGDRVPFGNDVLVAARDKAGFVLHTEVCEDIWVPIPPSTVAALAGATVLANLSASNITIGKAEYREQLVLGSSGRNVAVQMYSAAGFGESSTDLSWDGDGYVAERGAMLARTERFGLSGTHIVADVDLESLMQDRMRQSSFHQNASDHRRAFRTVTFEHRRAFGAAGAPFRTFRRDVDPHPFVPNDPRRRDERCRETFKIQATALARKLMSLPPEMRKVVIGVSGGQDSTLALLVAAHAMDLLALPRSGIIGVTMPGFGTTDRTYANACRLIGAIGATFKEIAVRDLSAQTFRDLGIVDAVAFIAEVKAGIASGDESADARRRRTFFENVQAWSRKHVLFSVSGLEGAMVLGTGDLSELLLGWCTMFGDHASHYGVNAGVPKTLISFLVRWTAEVIYEKEAGVREVLLDILDTEISPELLPPDEHGKIAQKTEEKIGPYELHDFFGYCTVRWGYRPSRIARLALHAFAGKYDIAAVKRWLCLFLSRFVGNQFKRSCLPDGPKVGLTAVSPRGDWRMPSDATARMWLAELEANVPDKIGK